MESAKRHGHVQAGWQETDEDILFPFIKALRRGDYGEALRIAPSEDGMEGWPDCKRVSWRAWVDLAHRMKGQREYEVRSLPQSHH